jgi:TonB family protein
MTNRMPHRIERYFIVAAMLCVFAGNAHGDDQSALAERLHHAAVSSSLDDASLKPWHLKLGFQLFDPKGKAAENGTIEEWWYAPEVHKTVYTSPSYTSTEIQTKNGFFRTRGASSAPYLLALVLQQIVHPMPDEKSITSSKPDMRKETIGKVQMDCIMLAQEIKGVSPPLGLFPTYCFERNDDTLRMAYDFGSQLTVLNHIGAFQQRHVGIDQTTAVNNVTAVTGHIEVLQGVTLQETDLVPSADFEKVSLYPIKVGSGVIGGLITSQPKPIYPERARENRISGTVVLGATIGRDGRVHSLRLISVPDPDLAIAALAAVREWRYSPYLLNGQSTEVQTTITVNFNLAPR